MDLIHKEISKKNEKVFKDFFEHHYEPLVLYVDGYLFDRDASQDIVQDIFVYIWEHASTLNIKTSLKGYLYAMARNRCLNYLKSVKITDNLEILDLHLNLMTEHLFDSASEEDKTIIIHQVLKIIDKLPDRMQQIVKLKFLHDYKYSEIANELGISINTVKTQLTRAKLRITELVTGVLILLQIHQ